MAQKVYTESVVTMNSASAEMHLKALNKLAESYRKEMEAAINAGDTTKAAKLAKEINGVEKAISSTKKKTYDYSQILRNIDDSTLNQLERTSRTLFLNMKNLVKGIREYA